MKRQMYLIYVHPEMDCIGLSELKEDKVESIFNDESGEFTNSSETSIWTEWEDCSTMKDVFKKIMKRNKE